jgi:hypothetical protein
VFFLLQVAALSIYKECMSCGKKYTKYIINHRLLAPVVALMIDINGQDNVLHSVALRVFQAAR